MVRSRAAPRHRRRSRGLGDHGPARRPASRAGPGPPGAHLLRLLRPLSRGARGRTPARPHEAPHLAVARFRRGHGGRLELDLRRGPPPRATATRRGGRLEPLHHRTRLRPRLRGRRGLPHAVAQGLRRAPHRTLRHGPRPGGAGEREPPCLRHSRQSRLVRQPGRLLQALLLAGPGPALRGLAHAAGAELLRPQAARRLVALRRRRAAPGRHRRWPDRLLPQHRRGLDGGGRPGHPVPRQPELDLRAEVPRPRRLRREAISSIS